MSLAIVALIFIQGKGGGLGSAWGGGGATYQSRRGVEKFTLNLTHVLVFLFFLLSITNFFIQ
ncbi:preprotein translocase subunit SecG [Candidatus Roizmanbacteria bacterium CG_4_9_14_0_2_um_filter_39_13]|uniref:Protein-export membrane protein SecG n=2 Tax=Candidatus Roizmaniibacteriota TaxID=1752723 RepID=A0A2M8EX59_9BACT|nr:MAG: preprotein translocase subunit SecG [Candidatus Roizmanbacteria bacterium CG_4_10_14_0_2_um_filter_39_12]PJC30466.1 MAG: preprotein translocase subunit SecG [Candidatus Roizmanbacteria bacterium CG_4_9_14_0_2_um_filter_39_13]PJE62072.1 MAG: preprotein translocase subunit SecG [Candidatus Roizmanbacteria bacterium CG10_big_fil_rev_8_21_14_0_10_39_12]